MTITPTPLEGRSEPVWEIATLFPAQGQWSEGDYLALETNHLVEFSHGVIEVLPMPTQKHQDIVAYLFELLRAFVVPRGLGKISFAALRVRLWEGKYREPDLLFMLAAHEHRRHNTFWERADLVMEVVSGSEQDCERDLVHKRAEYARAGIAAYWIIDPASDSIIVLVLVDGRYREHGRFLRNTTATSVLLSGFAAKVDAVLDAK